ncbi:MAG: MFS transporter [Tannerellaceae bacterium]|nr:MFS transporter [Tannerellaceae bacterium]
MESWKKKFAVIWSGQLFSILSSAIVQFAIVLWLSFETKSAEVLSFAMIAALLPQTLIGPFVGVFVDRWSRKRTMILADSFVAFCSAVLALLFYLDSVEIWHIYALLAFRSVGSAFHNPAMEASVPLLAPESELLRVSGINQVIYSICNIAGPALGAVFMTSFDMTYVLMFDVVGAIIACGSLLFVFIPNPEKKSEETERDVLREMREGFNVVYEKIGLRRMMMISITVTFFLMPVATLFPLMTLNHFNGNAFQMSLVEVIWGVGMLVGGAILSIWKFKVRKTTLINASYVVLGLTFLFSGVLPESGFVYFVILTALAGVSAPFFHGPFTSLLQIYIHPSYLGRVFSLLGSVSMLPSMVGLAATGYIADTIGVANSFIISGAVITVAGIYSFFIKTIRSLEQES